MLFFLCYPNTPFSGAVSLRIPPNYPGSFIVSLLLLSQLTLDPVLQACCCYLSIDGPCNVSLLPLFLYLSLQLYHSFLSCIVFPCAVISCVVFPCVILSCSVFPIDVIYCIVFPLSIIFCFIFPCDLLLYNFFL